MNSTTISAARRRTLRSWPAPCPLALSYGQGRVFHTALGHGLEAIKDVGFATTLQRGTEWAATGKVTQPVPANFPTATAVSPRP
jgi:type 1 glutamine amidotransferase